MVSLPEDHISLDSAMPMIRACLERGQTVTFRPRGTSMLPMLHEGTDRVTLSPLTGPLRKYDLPLYQRRNGVYVMHRIVKADKTYTCIGDNQFEFEYGVEHDQMIAVVSAFTHKGKPHSVNDWGYKLYSRYWCWSRPIRRQLCRAKNLLRRCFKGKK